jgi:hypothetical protein
MTAELAPRMPPLKPLRYNSLPHSNGSSNLLHIPSNHNGANLNSLNSLNKDGGSNLHHKTGLHSQEMIARLRVANPLASKLMHQVSIRVKTMGNRGVLWQTSLHPFRAAQHP